MCRSMIGKNAILLSSLKSRDRVSPRDNDMNYQHKLIAIAMAASLVCGGAMALTKDEYKAQKDRISANYKAAKNNCAELKSNAKDICVSEAKGAEKMANAELEAQYKPSEKATYKFEEARADAMYDTARERCDDISGNA